MDRSNIQETRNQSDQIGDEKPAEVIQANQDDDDFYSLIPFLDELGTKKILKVIDF